jgi:hypothetical protein
MIHKPSNCNSPLSPLHSATSSTARSGKKAINTLKCATTKGVSVVLCPSKKAHSSTPISSNDTEDTGMTLVSITTQLYSHPISGDGNMPSTEHAVIAVDRSDDGVDADLHKETAEEELSK